MNDAFKHIIKIQIISTESKVSVKERKNKLGEHYNNTFWWGQLDPPNKLEVLAVIRLIKSNQLTYNRSMQDCKNVNVLYIINLWRKISCFFFLYFGYMWFNWLDCMDNVSDLGAIKTTFTEMVGLLCTIGPHQDNL